MSAPFRSGRASPHAPAPPSPLLPAALHPISRSSEYAIRALTYLAIQGPEAGFVLGKHMAERLGMPAPFLGKILQPLVACGLLESQRGRRGGFRLAQPADEITLLQIVGAIEGLGPTRECFLGQAECSDERACPMHDYWKDASQEFERQLSETTLADVVRFCERSPQSGYPLPSPDGPR